MTEHNAKKPSMKQLYREVAASHAVASVPDADDLLELARVAHADEAASPLCANLLRFSRELEPASAQLSAQVAAAFDQTSSSPHRRALTRRGAAQVRRWRGVAAVSASLLAIVGVWTLQRAHQPSPSQTHTAAGTTVVQDRIFAAFNEHNVAGTSARDEIFHDQFSASQDVIFRFSDG